MAVIVIAQQETPGMILITGKLYGYVLKEWGPHIIPPVRTFYSSVFNLSEADLRNGSPLLKAVQENGGDVEHFKKQAGEWLLQQPGQKEAKRKAKQLAQKHVKTG